jgi:hypothetical protein
VNSWTSAKLRRACTPPAVAHAPIVTSVRDISRTCRIRSASSAVVIEPSTRDTSYGPAAWLEYAAGLWGFAQSGPELVAESNIVVSLAGLFRFGA